MDNQISKSDLKKEGNQNKDSTVHKLPNTIEIEDKLEQFERMMRKKNFDLPLGMDYSKLPKRHTCRGVVRNLAR